MAIVKELYAERADGVKLYRTYSDLGYKIRKVGTDEVYSEAVDVETASYEYEETDKKMSGGFDEASFEAGKKAERDAFWNDFRPTTHGNFSFAFAGVGWNEKTFNLTMDLSPLSANAMFKTHNGYNTPYSLTQKLKKLGHTIDFSRASSLDDLFCDAYLTEIPVIDATGSTWGLRYSFQRAQHLTTIEKIIVKEWNNENCYTSAFQNCVALENIVIEGVINQSLSFQWSTKLSHDSLVSIINCLSATTSGLTVTLSKEAVNKAFATSQGATDGSTSTEWLTLIATKSNWTISLI